MPEKPILDNIKCPVCGCLKLRKALRQHMVPTAKQEVYQYYITEGETKMLHQKWLERHPLPTKRRLSDTKYENRRK